MDIEPRTSSSGVACSTRTPPPAPQTTTTTTKTIAAIATTESRNEKLHNGLDLLSLAVSRLCKILVANSQFH